MYLEIVHLSFWLRLSNFALQTSRSEFEFGTNFPRFCETILLKLRASENFTKLNGLSRSEEPKSLRDVAGPLRGKDWSTPSEFSLQWQTRHIPECAGNYELPELAFLPFFGAEQKEDFGLAYSPFEILPGKILETQWLEWFGRSNRKQRRQTRPVRLARWLRNKNSTSEDEHGWPFKHKTKQKMPIDLVVNTEGWVDLQRCSFYLFAC